MKYSYVKNKFVKSHEATVSIKERGFRFGDGIFETIKIKNYNLCDYHLHLSRLKKGLKEIKIDFDSDKILHLADRLIKKNNQKNGFLRLSISRGIGSRGYYPTKSNPTLIIETENSRKIMQKEIDLGVSPYRKISPSSLPVNYKTMQGMNSTLSLIEAKEQGLFDSIILNTDGKITETSSANFFALKKGKIYTPPAKDGLLCGVVRQKIINNFSVIEKSISISDLKLFDALFITNIAIRAKELNSISEGQKIIWKKNTSPESQNKIQEIIRKINNFDRDNRSLTSGF